MSEECLVHEGTVWHGSCCPLCVMDLRRLGLREQQANASPYPLDVEEGHQVLINVCQGLAMELRELHLATGISLDRWSTARAFVEAFTGPIEDNGA